MKKNLYSLSLTVLILTLASCGRVVAPYQKTSLGDQQEPSNRQQTEASGDALAEQDQRGSEQTRLAELSQKAEQSRARTTESAVASGADRDEKRSSVRAPKLEKTGRAQRISRKDPFGDRYAQANQYSVGVHNQSPSRERSLLSASSLMMAAPAAAYAQARQRYDFSDPLYLALFIVLVVLLVILAIAILAAAEISTGGLVGVLLLALLIILLVILL